MLVSLTVRDLLVVSWAVDPEVVRRDLPQGVDPAVDAHGRALVSVASFRNEDVRAGGRRAPSFPQLNLRTYVARAADEAIFLLSARVGLAGLAGALVGVPVRPARIRLRQGAVDAPGLGVRIRYRRTAEPPTLPVLGGAGVGEQPVVLLVSAGLRRIETAHERFAWEAAELTEAPRVDPVRALGFDVGAPASTLYARSQPIRFELPAGKLP